MQCSVLACALCVCVSSLLFDKQLVSVRRCAVGATVAKEKEQQRKQPKRTEEEENGISDNNGVGSLLYCGVCASELVGV